MSLSWGLPWAFAGLAALLLPLLLHLDRRRSVQRVPFAALRWIAAQARPRRTWRIVEWLLLLLRMLLVALVVAWLAQPWLHGVVRAPLHWTVVAPGAVAPPAGEHVLWLAPGFPRVDAGPAPSANDASFASLLREFDAGVPAQDSLEVHVPPVVSGLDAAAIALSREVRWVEAVAASGDAPPARPARVLAWRHDDASPAVRHVRAAIRAWESGPVLAVRLDEGASDAPLPAGVDAVLCTPACLGPAAGTRRVVTLDADAFQASPWQTDEFPRWLHAQLFGAPPPPDRAPAAAIAPTATASAIPPPPTPLRPWLAWIVAATFLAERLLATLRRPRGAGDAA